MRRLKLKIVARLLNILSPLQLDAYHSDIEDSPQYKWLKDSGYGSGFSSNPTTTNLLVRMLKQYHKDNIK